MTRQDYTDVTLVLDRSGSMHSIADDVVGGVNSFVDEQKAVPGECRLTLIQFDDVNPHDVVHSGKPVQEIAALTTQTYQPRGNTPLWDAVGKAAVATGERLSAMPEHERPAHVIFVIMTDGLENASRDWTKQQVANLLKGQQEIYSWQVVYLGADHDAMAAGADMGIHHANVAAYGKQNFAGAAKTTSEKVRLMRAGTSKDMAYSADDRNKMA